MPATIRRAARLAALAGLVCASACGPAKPATQQFRGSLPVPTYPADPTQPFQLTDAEGSSVYNASLIIWAANPSPEQISTILNDTRDARAMKADALKFLAEQLIPAKTKTAAAQAKYDAFPEAIQEASKNVDQTAARDFVRGVAGTLVEDRLTDLLTGKDITADDKAHAEAIWPAYCEAKLWELATNVQLARRFKDRPTPVQLCEKYYTSRNYFADQDLCGPAKDASGKDYFSCLWNEGVLKSQLLTNKYRTDKCSTGKTHEQAITAWLTPDGGILKGILLGANSDDAATMQQVILGGGFIGSSFARRHGGAAGLGLCRTAFVRQEPQSQTAEDALVWAVYNPTTLLQIGEASETDSPVFTLLPLTNDEATNKTIYNKLTKYVRVFSERPGATHQTPSYSDETFNVVVGDPLVADPKDHDAVVNDPVFKHLKDFEPAAVKVLKAQQATALSELTALQTSYATLQTTYAKQIKAPIDSNRLATVAATQSPGAAVFLNNYYMNVDKVGGELHVKMGFDLATKTLVGCATIEDGSPCAVAAADLGKNGIEAIVTFDKTADLVSVKFVLDDPTALGFPQLPPAPGSVQFNLIPAGDLQGRTVQIDNYGNKLHDNLSILAGSGYIEDADGSNRTYVGSLTGDNFTQREQILDKQYGL